MTRQTKWKTELLAILLLAALGAAACAQDPSIKQQRALERGHAYLAQEKYNEAIIELKNALQIDPMSGVALHALGRAYMGKAWYADALRELQRAVELRPDFAPARIELGRVYLEFEAWNEALAQGEAVREKDTANAHALYLIGAGHLGSGRSNEALEWLSKALALDPSMPEIHKALGDTLARLDRAFEPLR